MIIETTRERAEKLAEDIRAERIGLDGEDARAEPGTPLRSYSRAKKYREQDRAKLNGMRIALSYLLGVPMDMQLADAFIDRKPEFLSMLPEELRAEFSE